MNRPKGTKDIYGKRQAIRTLVKDNLKAIARLYNFKEIETPIFEKMEVFVKSVGETSDIVSKEMFMFNDKKNRLMALRPEGTAGTIRAVVENKLFAKLPLKLFYMGPMFRYENPQRGRQRQFTQFGIELLSKKSPYIDAEVILMAHMIIKSFNLNVELQINSLGDKVSRDNWSKALKKYFAKYHDQLSTNSISRIKTNPMRILDDKIDGKKDFVINAPKIEEFYSPASKIYFNTLTLFLKEMGIDFTINKNLVRGLDYYTDTIFEFVSKADSSGAQSTIIGGGRYKNLVLSFGGPDISGIGFGLGVERLVNDWEVLVDDDEIKQVPKAFVLNISPEVQIATAGLVHMLRSGGVSTEWNAKPIKLQKAFQIADRSGAYFKIIAGKNELSSGMVMLKYQNIQKKIKIDDLISYIDKHGGE